MKRLTQLRKIQIENTRARNAKEIAWEAAMSTRIAEESAVIRAEWDEQTRNARTVCKQLVVSVREANTGRGRHNGVDFSW